MRIIQVNNWCRGRGGIEITVEATTRLLKQRGMNVSVMARNSQDLARGLRGRVHAFVSAFYSLSSKTDMRRLIRSERPDIAHVHNIYPFLSPSVLSECRRIGLPVVMSIHSYYLTCPTYHHLRNGKICEMCVGGHEYWCIFKNCKDNILESVSYAIRGMVARKMKVFEKNVTLFIALTNFAKNRLVDAGFEDDRIVVLPNLVAIPNVGVNPSTREYVAFVGRFSAEKGIDTLLSAAQSLLHIPMRLAGDWSLMPELVWNRPKNAEFVGFLNQIELVTFYSKARCLILPSKCFEVCPLVISEAMSYGLPVIASRIGGLSELVEDGVTGFLFEPGNSEDLTSKIKLLWENPGLCQQMGQAGREKVIREYSEDVYYERLISVYKKAIKINQK